MPTPEERNALVFLRDFFYQARDALGRLKDKVEVLIAQMEDTLATNPTSTSMLRRRIENAEKAWTEFEGQYDQLRAIAGQGRLQDQGHAEQDSTYYVALQHCYLEVHTRAKDALDNDQNTGEVRPRELTSEQKVQQYTTKREGVHRRIDRALEEIETSLEGNPIDSLEVLKVEKDQLMQVKESLKESASLIESITTEDP